MIQLVADTRLPDEPIMPGVSWDYGTDLHWLKIMKEKWVKDFDWKTVEARMNAFSHFRVPIEGINLHFIHQRSTRADAVPLILTHGWPGSFWEFHRIIEPLTNPPAGEPAFHVVVPSVPGFGFSSAPPKAGWTMKDNARIFNHLMTGVLGYESYMAQGGDIGSLVTIILATDAYPACKLINLNAMQGPPTLGAMLTLPFFLLPTTLRQWLYSKIYTEDELRDFGRSFQAAKSGMAYFLQQATRPATIGYALYDSPVGLLAWMGDKFRDLFDPQLFESHAEDILISVSLYYLTRTFPTSTLPYSQNTKLFKEQFKFNIPYGLSRFPYDVFMNPVSWLKSANPTMSFVRRHEKGGHFPALEVPELLVGDLREMVATHKVF
ncbi:alpha/beta-hydrolase [Panus rudis PR-1116 ss-1]|nr:alpha/beta-hydrolase [Panus rudis PR-1116 ss-1]